MKSIVKNYSVLTLKNASRTELHDKLGLTSCEISINELPAGASVPFVHSHKQNEEIYIILQGSGMLFIDNEELKIKKDDVIFIKPNGKRCFCASKGGILKFVCIQAKINSLEQFTLNDGIINDIKPSWLK